MYRHGNCRHADGHMLCYHVRMPLTCNIGAKGKAARLIWGLLLIVAGVLLAIFRAWPNDSMAAWVIASLLFAGGAFAVFEARAGWCVVRAMGLKTPL